MNVGAAVIFQNLADARTDRQTYRDDLALADLVEPLGFESIWCPEHHFTDYNLAPDPMQFLTYMAGRTEHVKLGSMVVVLPWHQPVRVAEAAAMLDHLSGGRVVLGLGRGIGRIEYEGFGVSMDDSRQFFTEAATMVVNALEDGYAEFDGELVKQARRDVRPRPFASFRGRTYAAAVSPESMEILARLGVGMLVVPQKPWHVVERDLATYRELYLEVNGTAAPRSTLAGWVFCDEDESRARELGRRYIGAYYESVLAHYELMGRTFEGRRGYELYAEMAGRLREAGEERAVEFFVDLNVCGTPEQCFEQILEGGRHVDNDRFIGVFSYGNMPAAEGERNMRLFAAEVLPRLQAVEAHAA